MKIVRFVSLIYVSLFYLATFALAQESVQSSGKIELGDKAAPLVLSEWVKVPDGFTAPVDVMDGKNVYVVEFWSTDCSPCVQEIPHLTELQKAYKDKGVVFVSISPESANVIKPFVAKQGDAMNYIVALDQDGATCKTYQVGGVPRAYIINRKSEVVWTGLPRYMEEILIQVLAEKYSKEDALRTAEIKAKIKEYYFLVATQKPGADKMEESLLMIIGSDSSLYHSLLENAVILNQFEFCDKILDQWSKVDAAKVGELRPLIEESREKWAQESKNYDLHDRIWEYQRQAQKLRSTGEALLNEIGSNSELLWLMQDVTSNSGDYFLCEKTLAQLERAENNSDQADALRKRVLATYANDRYINAAAVYREDPSPENTEAKKRAQEWVIANFGNNPSVLYSILSRSLFSPSISVDSEYLLALADAAEKILKMQETRPLFSDFFKGLIYLKMGDATKGDQILNQYLGEVQDEGQRNYYKQMADTFKSSMAKKPEANTPASK